MGAVFLIWLGLVTTVQVIVSNGDDRQLHRLERDCNCRCGYILSPAVDVVPALRDGETLAWPDKGAKWNDASLVCGLMPKERWRQVSDDAYAIYRDRQSRESLQSRRP